MNKNLIVGIFLVVMVIITGVQAVQLNSLRDSVENGAVGKVSLEGGSVSASSGSSVPKSLQDLPTMVGGC